MILMTTMLMILFCKMTLDGGGFGEYPTSEQVSQKFIFEMSINHFGKVFFVIPCVDMYEIIDMRTQTFDVPPQEVQLILQFMYKNKFKLSALYFHFLLLVTLFLFLDFDQRQRHSVCERHHVLQSEFTIDV